MASNVIETIPECCVICKASSNADGIKSIINLTRKGRETLLEYSCLYRNTVLTDLLTSNPDVLNVHESCRKSYTNKRRYEQYSKHVTEPVDEGSARKQLRSSTANFDPKVHCFFCGESVEVDKKHPNRRDISYVRTMEISGSVLQRCAERGKDDKLALDVRIRLQMYSDLCAADAMYHRLCHTSFFFSRPTSADDDIGSVGRPVPKESRDAFEELCEWLEFEQTDVCTFDELQSKLQQMKSATNETHYSAKHLKRLLEKRFGDHIFFAEVNGRRNVVCFRNMASRIINDKWYTERAASFADESMRIILAAAKLIKSQIREAKYTTEEYPCVNSIDNLHNANSWIPSLLQTFIANLVPDERKKTALGHAIVQATRPRSAISPLLFGIAVSLDHVFGSKWLITTLARFGFCLSYDEVTRFKQSVTQCDVGKSTDTFPAGFTQWTADNVDHNVATLDGLGSLHGMGIISMTTPFQGGTLRVGTFSDAGIPRMHRSKVANITRSKGIPILQYTSVPKTGLSTILFKPRLEVGSENKDLLHKFSIVDTLWHTGWFFRSTTKPRVSWNGFMQDVCTGPYLPAADIRILPIIDMSSTDYSCIYSTLLFVQKQAEILRIETPCITFDQPLWLKAVDIITSQQLNIVCILGKFHVMMNFACSIGTVMEGSGLEEVLCSCYGPNTVTQMLSGKSFARSLRGHFLVEAALYVILLKKIMPSEDEMVESDFSILSRRELEEIHHLFDDVENKDCDASDVSHMIFSYGSILTVQDLLTKVRQGLGKISRTARLWLQYLDYVQILKALVRAERTGDWELHLYAVSSMLNLFAATGHFNYAKSARMYVQQMLELPSKSPWLYDKFVNGGCHTVRRSNRFWAGLSTDLTIEQVMMKAIKSRGGLTHGRGVTESVRTIWANSMHECAAVHSAVANITQLDHTSAEMMHVEMGKSRVSRDNVDLLKMIAWFETNNPFEIVGESLQSLASGVTTDDSEVNCDATEEVGSAVMAKMDNAIFTDVILKKRDTVKTLTHAMNKVQVEGKTFNIDPLALFSRLIIVMERAGNIEPHFAYELTQVPTSLFRSGTMRKTDKSKLAKEISKGLDTGVNLSLLQIDRYVIDGGCLLHKVKWRENSSYLEIMQQYLTFIKQRYGSAENVVIVFDGYANGPSVKDHERERRGMKRAPEISVDAGKQAFRSQHLFLLSENNKKQFVSLLSNHLRCAGYTVEQAGSDADTLIVQTALNIARNEKTVVVADDTDVLVMLTYHWNTTMQDIFMLSQTQSRRVVYSARAISKNLGGTVCKQLLVIHGISGCDSTSAVFGHGKSRVLKLISSNANTVPLTNVLSGEDSSHDAVKSAGLQLLAMMYGGKAGDNLNHMRYISYMNLSAGNKSRLRPESLPPTERAACFHVLRVHVQVVQWKMLKETTNLLPEDWGWKVQDGRYVPIMTDQPAAAPEILKVVRCGCKTGTKNPCGTNLCICHQHGLKCVPACKNCNGQHCENISEHISQNSDTESGEDDNVDFLGDDVPYECIVPDIPWINEETVETC